MILDLVASEIVPFQQKLPVGLDGLGQCSTLTGLQAKAKSALLSTSNAEPPHRKHHKLDPWELRHDAAQWTSMIVKQGADAVLLCHVSEVAQMQHGTVPLVAKQS